MKESWQVVLAGEGGQGLVMAGILLGEAAVLEGKNASQVSAYGIASRGGFAKSEVIISDTEIEYPGVEEPDLVLALSESAMEKYYGKVADTCLLVYDSSAIKGNFVKGRICGLPFSATIQQYREREKVTLPLNILGLGALAGLTGLVQPDSLSKAARDRFKKDPAINLEALKAGLTLAKSVGEGADTP